jgi:hypothetical protein
MRATIIKDVELQASKSGVSVDDVSGGVPVMRLEDGREVGAYFCDRYIAIGREGEAEYDAIRRVWHFTPDGSSQIDTDDLLPPHDEM